MKLYKTNNSLRQVIIKLSQTCNIDCSYCYVYHMGDESWRKRPKQISITVIDELVKKIHKHCNLYNLEYFHVELHGGEPLLVGKKKINYLLESIKFLKINTHFTFSIQTNGLLLDSEWVILFQKYSVNIGISIDGPVIYTDQYRKFKSGLGTLEKLLHIIDKIKREIPSFKPGVLCVLNKNSNVPKLIDWFFEKGFHSFDFLLPSGNYKTKPFDVPDINIFTNKLIEGFDHWVKYEEKAPQIRIYELIIESFLGRKISLDSLGGDLKQLCVVESDGSIGVNDVSRMCGGIFSNDIINLFDHDLDYHETAYDLENIQKLNTKCKSCNYLKGCGGGYLPHRFDGQSFKNPTIYCETIYKLNQHIEKFVIKNLPMYYF